jgi:putative transposase
MEDLNVAGMLRNHRLAKHIACASFGEFKRQLVYKAKMHAKLVLLADRWFASSKTCSCCGHLHAKMPLAIRTFKCENCGCQHDRDINAAKNLENLLTQWVKDQAAAGQAVFGRGGLVRLAKAHTLASCVLGSVNPPSSTYA